MSAPPRVGPWRRVAAALLVALLTSPGHATAQVRTDGTLGSAVTLSGPIYNIVPFTAAMNLSPE